MRSTTAGELTTLAAPTRTVTHRVKVANGSGTMIDLTSWVDHVTWDMDIDQPVSGATVYFARASGSTQSLSPLRSDSTLNVDDAMAISAQLDVGRTVTIEAATTPIGTAPVAGDYKLMFSGTIDAVNFEDSPINVSCRDKGGLLVDRWIGLGATTTVGTGTVLAIVGAATFSVSQAGVLANGYAISVNGYGYIVSSFSGTTTAILTPTNKGPTTFGAAPFTISPYRPYTIYGTTPGIGTVNCGLGGAATFSVSQAGKLANDYIIVVNDYEYVVSAFNGTTGATLTRLSTSAPTVFGASAFVINAKILEGVIQEILDAWVGAGSLDPVTVTLNTPVSPSFMVTGYKQQNQSVMEALQALAGTIGWDVRYKYDSGSGTFKLTLSQPDRAKTTPDYTFGPSQYFDVSRLNIDRTNIRNYIEISYFRASTKTRESLAAGDSTSQSRYGLRYMKIEEPDDSPINSVPEATALITAVLSDLKDPKAEQEIELPFFWPAELGDLYRHSPNAVHYNANQDYAVVRIEHELGPSRHRTTLKTRGRPAGAHVNWLIPPRPHPLPFTSGLISPVGITLIDAISGLLESTLKDSTGTEINKAFHKPASTDPDNIDSVPNGSTYGRPLISRLSGGKPLIDFGEGIHIGKNLDNIADGGTYGRPLLSRLNAGKPVIDFTEAIHTGKNIDNIADGSTFLRVAGVNGSNRVTQSSIAAASVGPTEAVSRNRVRITHSLAQTTSTGTPLVLAFNTESYDSNGLHDTVTNNSRITIPSGGNVGTWLFIGQVTFIFNAAGDRYVIVYKNGAQVGVTIVKAAGGTGTVVPIMVPEDAPAVGDYYELGVQQDSGGNLNVSGGNPNTWFSAIHVW